MLRAAVEAMPDRRALWLPSCPFHCYYERADSEVAQMVQAGQGSGVTLANGLKMFTSGIKDPKRGWTWIDEAHWPENSQCAFWNMIEDNELEGKATQC